MKSKNKHSRRKFLQIATSSLPVLSLPAKGFPARGTNSEPAQRVRSSADSFSIIEAAEENPVATFAARELQRYLEEMTGGSVTIGNDSASHRLYVGGIPPNVSADAALEARNNLEGLREDGFIIRSIGRDIVLMGKGNRGDLYACYAFLERLGVRWFFPGKQYECVPHVTINWGVSYNISESPAIRKRILFYWPNNYSPLEDWIDFAAKARLNRIAFHYTWPARDWWINLQAHLLPLLEKRGLELEIGGHFLSSFLPRDLIKTHPEWFRMDKKGDRINDYNFNPFSADALSYLNSSAGNYLLKMPDARLFHVWADDIEGGGWSLEPGKEQYTASDQALLVYNDLIGRVRQKLPHAKLSFLAYHDTVFPPHVVKPTPGIVFFYAPRERCYAHALDDPACSLNQKYAQALEKALPEFNSTDAEVFEYYTDQILFENLINPPLPDIISKDAEYYQRLGLSGVGSLMTNTSNFATPMVNMFLYPQAQWDTRLDLWKSLDDYATLYFGYPGLKKYFRELNLGLKDVLKVCPYQHPGDAWYSLRVDREDDCALEFRVRSLEEAITGPLTRAVDLLNRAMRETKAAPYAERLAGEQKSMGFTLRQAKLYYHLLKGELSYRNLKATNDSQAGLSLGTELVLARYHWEKQKGFVSRAKLKGRPMIPNPDILSRRWDSVVKEVVHIPPHTDDLNPGGYSLDGLSEHLMKGITGATISAEWGSIAVVWTDLPESKSALGSSRQGLAWLDEFGRPLQPGSLNLYSEPVVVSAKGMPADQLFNAVASTQAAD
jgi:Domain of unknown function (DUF4838)/Glycosyl hydrolase family 67 N-terminus